jgi:hypothetical protein
MSAAHPGYLIYLHTPEGPVPVGVADSGDRIRAAVIAWQRVPRRVRLRLELVDALHLTDAQARDWDRVHRRDAHLVAEGLPGVVWAD